MTLLAVYTEYSGWFWNHDICYVLYVGNACDVYYMYSISNYQCDMLGHEYYVIHSLMLYDLLLMNRLIHFFVGLLIVNCCFY